MKIINASRPEDAPLTEIKWCHTFLQKGLGLMFKKSLGSDEGIILADGRESRLNTAIHMLFMNFNITVLWLDRNRVVVDKVLAEKWKPFYLPQQPAQYVVELHENQFDKFAVGDKLIFEE